MDQNSLTLLTKQEENNSYNSCCFKCCNIFNWILSILTWGSIICIIILSKKEIVGTVFYIIICCSYALEIFIEYCSSSTLSKLRSKTNKKLDQIILDYTTTLPEINFKCYEKIYNGYKISSSTFPYIFCRDISGNLIFDKEEFKNKHYLQLNINREIYSNDKETFKLFTQKKNQFYQTMTNGRKWVDISFPGYNTNLFINIGIIASANLQIA